MWANEPPAERNLVFGKQFINAAIAGFDIEHCQVAAANTGLICYTDQSKPRSEKKHHRLGCALLKFDLEGVT